MRARLDATDWRILKELQANGRITNVELAEKVGISPPPCLRRVRALEQAGMIAGYFAQLDEKMVGFEVIAFAMVGLHSQSEADLRAFENRVLAWPLVRECYMLSGETDFLLKCVAPDLTAFQDFVIEELTAARQRGERQDHPHHPPRQVRARRADRRRPGAPLPLRGVGCHPGTCPGIREISGDPGQATVADRPDRAARRDDIAYLNSILRIS